MRMTALLTASLLVLTPAAFAATETWDDLADSLFEDRALHPAQDTIVIDAPYRTQDDARTIIAARLTPPDSRLISRITLVLDENPMPVSAVFNFSQPVPRFNFEATMRINGPTPVHLVMETTDGQLYVAETFVKTSGLGACSAPPGTDPEEAMASLGEIEISIEELAEARSLGDRLSSVTSRQKQVDVDISHPSHSGMQMDQISLLFIPMRYVENIDIAVDGQEFVDVTGSISLSENPRLSLSVPGNTGSVGVTMTDTDGTVTHKSKSLAGY